MNGLKRGLTILIVFFAGMSSLATSGPRAGNKIEIATEQIDPVSAVTRTFEVDARWDGKDYQQTFSATCTAISVVDNVDSSVDVEVSITPEGSTESVNRTDALHTFGRHPEDRRIFAVGVEHELGCQPGEDCSRTFTVSCRHVDDENSSPVEIDMAVEVEVRLDAGFMKCSSQGEFRAEVREK